MVRWRAAPLLASCQLHGIEPWAYLRDLFRRVAMTEGTALPLDRQRAAVRFILRRQNDDGGFGSYEPRRGSMVLRHFNPAETSTPRSPSGAR
jgi:hypothetical protein